MTRAERSIQSLPSDKARIENDFIYFFLSSLPYTSVSSLPGETQTLLFVFVEMLKRFSSLPRRLRL